MSEHIVSRKHHRQRRILICFSVDALAYSRSVIKKHHQSRGVAILMFIRQKTSGRRRPSRRGAQSQASFSARRLAGCGA